MRSQHHCGYLCQHSYFHTLQKLSRVFLHSRVEHSPTTRRLHQEPKRILGRTAWEKIFYISQICEMVGVVSFELTTSRDRLSNRAYFGTNHQLRAVRIVRVFKSGTGALPLSYTPTQINNLKNLRSAAEARIELAISIL